ncbi:MAG: A/G-specific adenine glycosylase [Desulfopila sp.]
MIEHIEQMRQLLLDWFRTTRRQLPWRQTYDPYHIWLSEIMLQQTQMERGVVYFNRWIKRFPDIEAVAAAREQEILKYWEGLGYYARARNLHAAAKILVDRFAGTIPCDLETLRSLPGIGPYTAAAIASIACNQPVAVIDANVLRVYARLFDIAGPVKSRQTRRSIEELARQILPGDQARQFNQALMDFGGLLCTPKRPGCGHCPLNTLCLAVKRGTVAHRPVTQHGKRTILIEMATGLLESGGKVFIQQRLHDDIWGGLWEFPGGQLREGGEDPRDAVVREYREETGFAVTVCSEITTVVHFYTRYKVVLHCYGVHLESGERLQPAPVLTAAQDFRWLEPEKLVHYGFPAGHRKLLEHIAENCPELLYDPCLKEELSS